MSINEKVTSLKAFLCAVAFIAFAWLLVLGADKLSKQQLRNGACLDVLHCVDIGVDREHCDQLFPACDSQ